MFSNIFCGKNVTYDLQGRRLESQPTKYTEGGKGDMEKDAMSRYSGGWFDDEEEE